MRKFWFIILLLASCVVHKVPVAKTYVPSAYALLRQPGHFAILIPDTTCEKLQLPDSCHCHNLADTSVYEVDSFRAGSDFWKLTLNLYDRCIYVQRNYCLNCFFRTDTMQLHNESLYFGFADSSFQIVSHKIANNKFKDNRPTNDTIVNQKLNGFCDPESVQKLIQKIFEEKFQSSLHADIKPNPVFSDFELLIYQKYETPDGFYYNDSLDNWEVTFYKNDGTLVYETRMKLNEPRKFTFTAQITGPVTILYTIKRGNIKISGSFLKS